MWDSRGCFTNFLPLHWGRQTQLAFFGDDLALRKNRAFLSLHTCSPFPCSAPPYPPFFVLLWSTSFPRYYLFLTGFNKAAPKEETRDSASETLPDRALRKELRWGRGAREVEVGENPQGSILWFLHTNTMASLVSREQGKASIPGKGRMVGKRVTK